MVHGASGAVGIAAIQWAKNAGLKVIGTASSGNGRELVEDQGADFVFDHSKPGYLDEILKATAGEGVDIILEMLANVNLVKDFGSACEVWSNCRDRKSREFGIRPTPRYGKRGDDKRNVSI